MVINSTELIFLSILNRSEYSNYIILYYDLVQLCYKVRMDQTNLLMSTQP